MQVVGDDIGNAAGVAFTFTTKAGIGLSGMTGRGFVLRKVTEAGSGVCCQTPWTSAVSP
jgi:hypothetical protein